MYVMVACSGDDEEDVQEEAADQHEAAPFDEIAETTALLAELAEICPRWKKLGKTIDYGVLSNKPPPSEGKK